MGELRVQNSELRVESPPKTPFPVGDAILRPEK